MGNDVMQKDDLGDRMKSYEAIETARRFDHCLPVYARIDGRGFSRFTKGMERPFDKRMTDCMIDVTGYLVEQTHAVAAYVQSDEISIAWADTDDPGRNGLFFSGKVQKQCSVLASMAAARFSVAYHDHFGSISRDFPHFDCRVLQMPSRMEVANMFLWRAMDARKNAVSMVARHHFSHSSLQNKSTTDMIGMLAEQKVDMEDYPPSFTCGTWLKRTSEPRTLTAAELERIPERHRPTPETVVERSSIKRMPFGDFSRILNREEVIFGDAVPIRKP